MQDEHTTYTNLANKRSPCTSLACSLKKQAEDSSNIIIFLLSFGKYSTWNHSRRVYHKPHLSIMPQLAAHRTELKPLPELPAFSSKPDKLGWAWITGCHCKKKHSTSTLLSHPWKQGCHRDHSNPTGSQNLSLAAYRPFLVSYGTCRRRWGISSKFHHGWQGCGSLHYPRVKYFPQIALFQGILRWH